MSTEAIIQRMKAREAERRHDELCRAAAFAVWYESVTIPHLVRHLSTNITRAAQLIDELVRLEICIVRYDAAVWSSIDRYPVDPEFLERCRAKLPAHQFTTTNLTEVIKGVLSTQE